MRPPFVIKVATCLLLALAAWPGEDAQSSTVTASTGAGAHTSTISAPATTGTGTGTGTGGSNLGGSGSTADTDGDGMPDDWENRNGTDPNKADADDDYDDDGLSNGAEEKYSTYPWNPYSDGDLKKDGEDGWALDKDLYPPRLPEPHYAVIDLTQAGASGDDHPLFVNDDGAIVMANYTTYVSSFWKEGVSTAIPAGFTPKSLANDGYVYGMLSTPSPPYYAPAKWKVGSPPAQLTYTPPGMLGVEASTLIAASDNGLASISGWGWTALDEHGSHTAYKVYNAILPTPGLIHELVNLISYGDPANWCAQAVNKQGYAVGRGYLASDTLGSMPAYAWNGTSLESMPSAPQEQPAPTCLTNGTSPFVEGGTFLVAGGYVWGYTGHDPAPLWVKTATEWKLKMFKEDGSAAPDAATAIEGQFDKINDRLEVLGYFEFAAGTKDFCFNGRFWKLDDLVTDWGTINGWTADLNNHGVIVTTAKPIYDQNGDPVINPTPKPVMLVPIEFFDSKDTTLDNGNDVSITPKKDANDKSLSSVAWIAPHGAANGKDPAMPYLVLRCPGTDQMNLKIKWKLKVEYKRPSGRTLAEDTVTIQSGGQTWAPETFNGTLKFYDNADWKTAIGNQSDALQAGRGFFGGNATLTWQLMKSDGSPLIDEQTILFRIAGKNPDDATCRQYIDKVANDMISQSQTLMWYAYAIAKSETKDEGGEQYYNQFLKRGDKYRDKKGSEGVPDWNNDGKGKPGGYGVKQVTGYKGNENGDVPRSVIWNWEHNVDEGMRELAKINKEARSWMQRQRSAATKTLPTHTVRSVVFSDGTPHTMEDAVAIKRYNGASRRPQPDTYSDPGTGGFSYANEVPRVGHYCYWDKGRDKWSLSRYNNFNGGFNYVDRVCQEVEP